MTEHEPLDPELAALFANERVPAPSDASRARVLRRASAAIAMGAVAPHAAASAAKSIGVRSLALAAGTFVLGGAVGATLAIVLRHEPPPRTVYVERPIPPVVAPPSAQVPTAVVADEPTGEPARKLLPTPSATSTITIDTLAVERGIIDDARAKLASGDPGAALRRLDEHARRFPKARLEEEREALAIQALVNAGKPEDARVRARTFRERWPKSVYAAAVDVTMQSIP